MINSQSAEIKRFSLLDDGSLQKEIIFTKALFRISI
jgi:hypothetical protein